MLQFRSQASRRETPGMSKVGYATPVQTKSIRVLTISPDNRYEVREVEHNLATMQELVGGYVEALYTEDAILWINEDSQGQALPINHMATYLWWTLNPAMEKVDYICGQCFVTGPAHKGEATPVTDNIINHFKQMEQIRHDTED